MALIDNKITDGDISTYGVVSAPDRLTGTANENKQVFDNLIKQAVKVKMNELIDDLIAASAAGQLGASAPSGLSGNNIQAVLQSLKTYVDNTKVAKVPGKELSSNDYTDEDKALVAQIPDKAGTDNVLTKNNTTPFDPVGDYNPCTKKYADDLALTAGVVKSVFGRAGAVVARNGDYTPEQVGAEPAFSVLPVSKGGTGQSSLSDVTVGRANFIGALSEALICGFKGNIPNDGTADLKNFTETGIYRGLGGSFVDRPPGLYTSYGVLTVFNANSYIQQYFSCIGPEETSQVFFRQKTSVWGKWIGLHTANGYLEQVLTQAEYDSLPQKDATTFYNIVG